MKANLPETRDRLKAEYWLPKLRHRKWMADGKVVESASWYVRLQVKGRQVLHNLNETDRTVAARKAKDIYKKVAGAGWEAAFADKRLGISDPSGRLSGDATIGDYIEASKSYARSLMTHAASARCLRLIVGEQFRIRVDADEDRIAHIAAKLALAELRRRQAAGDKKAPPHGGKRHSKREKAWLAAQAETAGIREEAVRRLRYDHKANGREAWIKAVDAVRLAKLTPTAVDSWRTSRLHAAQRIDADEASRAEITTSSVLRQASSLFRDKVVRNIRRDTKLVLPEVLPFDGVDIGRPELPKFEVQVPYEKIVRAAADIEDVEVRKAFFLGATCGLRRREMDALCWDSFVFSDTDPKLVIRRTKKYGLKTKSSEAAIPLDAAVAAFFKQRFDVERARRNGFVLAGEAKTGALSRAYRCERTHQALLEWVRAQGIVDRRPIHHLRKLCGDAVNKQAGIYAASSYLRHSGVRVTEQSYVDTRARVAPNVSAVLGDKVISLPVVERSKPKAKKATP